MSYPFLRPSASFVSKSTERTSIKSGTGAGGGVIYSKICRAYVILICTDTFLPVVLYGCETWSLTIMEEHRLRVESWVLRRIFGPKREEVAGGWRKLHSEEFHNL